MRIEWDPFDVDHATIAGGVATVHRSGVATVVAQGIHDMRWLADDTMMSITQDGVVELRRDGRLVSSVNWPSVETLLDARICANGMRFVAKTRHGISVEEVTTGAPRTRTVLAPEIREREPWGLAGVLSGDGARLAIAYHVPLERSTVVLDVNNGRELDQLHARYSCGELCHGIEFDDAGMLLVQGIPEPIQDAWNVLAVGAQRVKRDVPGDVSAVAIDRAGELVAYAYREAPSGARGRLRVDYLATGDTQTLDCDLPMIDALSFSRDRRRLACMASSGAFEIVPVP